jgi:RNA polymerase sigma-70 factor (subfamily 1)
MTTAEERILDRAQAGDTDALVGLLEKHGRAVRQAIAGRIPRRWRSMLSEDDVMQQTYVDAMLGIGRFVYQGEGSFRAWLASLAKCNLLDAVKALEAEKRGGGRRRVTEGLGDESYVALYEYLGAISATPSRDAAGHEARDALGRALEQLPASYRRVVEMYDLQGREIEDVAAALNRSKGAVYMLRARAHRQLAEIMGTVSRYLTKVS